MRTFKLKIVDPEKLLFDGDAQYCGITTEYGSLGIEAMHSPMIAVLKADSEIQIRDAAGIEKTIPVAEGILSFRQNTCTITATKQ